MNENTLKKVMSELGKKSVESRRNKLGEEGFRESMRKIARKKRKRKISL